MSALFAHVVKQAFITFDRANSSAFKSNFNTLKLLVDQLTSKDLNIDPELMNEKCFTGRLNKAPVTYLEIFECNTFTMSVFIVANKYTMPLHDHPGYGLLRVISGTARVQSYSINSSNINQEDVSRPFVMEVMEEPVKDVSKNTETSVLTPTTSNIHEITAVGSEPAAFFDILSPPYESELSINGPKKCLFYRKLHNRSKSVDSSSSNKNDERKSVFLQHINAPSHYYCNTVRYLPPSFLSDINFLKSSNI